MNILIVDDSDDSRMVLKKILESEGHVVEEAINGKEALKLTRKSPPSMIISDIFMPVMDGFTLCRECKDDQRLKEIPFIFYTATYGDTQDEKLAFQFGADRFIRKPVGPDEFISIIRGMIEDMEKGRILFEKPTVEEEKDAFKLYSERLVNKLEKKMLDLEREVAKRKQAEEILRTSEKRFREMADLLPQTVFETNGGRNLTFVNRNGLDTFGYTEDDFDDALHTLKMIAPGDRDRAGKDVQKVLNGEKLDGIEYTALRKDGTSFPVLVYSSPVIDDNTVKGMRGILIDIADRKEAEDALNKSEEYFRALIENSMELVTVIEEDGTIRYESPSSRRVLGYEPEELVGENVLDYIHPDDLQKAIDALMPDNPETPTKEISMTLRFHHKDGSWPVLEAEGRDLRDHPAVQGIVINSRNITDRQEAEELIRRSLREKEILLAEIHHRVKNNMQIISSLLSLQSRDIKDERALALIRNCENRIRSMVLVHEKLYLSRDLSRVNFKSYMEDLAIRLFQTYRTDSRIIHFSSEIKDVFFNIETAIPLGLIINELVSNALKHAFPDGRKGNISTGLHFDRETERYTLTITDDGTGFPEGIDYQNPETFGLLLVGMLTEQLGGTVELDRSNGTAFKMIFQEQQYKKRI